MSRSLSSLTRSFRSLSTAPPCASSLSRRAMGSTSEEASSSSSTTPAVVPSSSELPPSPASPAQTEIDSPAESSTSSRPPYSFPNHLPHQMASIYHPTVKEGRETRRVHDREVPKEGTFTAENAWLTSMPLEVRRRLAYKLDKLPVGESLDILAPSDLKMWWKDRIAGKLPTNPLTPEDVRLSQTEYLRARIEKKRRIRGQLTHTDEDGETSTTVVGQRIYLPNIVFKLVRNNTAFIRGPGGHPIGREPYNPFIATFRVPKATTKQDVRSYLKAVYNLDTTFVRTDIRLPEIKRTKHGLTRKDSHQNYKRAVVGLTEPFHYPDDIDEMDRQERELERKRLEFTFNIERRKEQYKRQLLTLKTEKKSTKNRAGASGRLNVILARTAERRDRIENALREQAQLQRQRRHEEDNHESI